MTYLIVGLIVMALASFLPRVIPLVFIRKKIKSKFIKSFLYYMPYAVLSSLTFPAVFYATGNVVTSSIGTALALVLSLFIEKNFYIVALLSVATVFGLSFVF